MVDQGAEELGLGGPFLDARGVVGVHGLSAGDERERDNESEEEQGSTFEHGPVLRRVECSQW